MNYLRVSVTDRCNLRCSYCMPSEKINFLPKEEILSYSEISRLIRCFHKLGVNKIRFTGGEPFVRKDFMELLSEIRSYSKDLDIHITSNATLLSKYIEELKHLNVRKINISLDTLNENKFFEITRRKELSNVLASIEDCIKNDFEIKINMVVKRNVNFEEIHSMIQYFKVSPIELRFIEYMPFNEQEVFINHVEGNSIENEVKEYFPNLYTIPRPKNSTSTLYKLDDTDFRIGIIEGYSRSFCDSCNRIRLTSTGLLKTCLYADPASDLKSILRSGITDTELSQHIKKTVSYRYKDGNEAEKNRSNIKLESMSKIGG